MEDKDSYLPKQESTEETPVITLGVNESTVPFTEHWFNLKTLNTEDNTSCNSIVWWTHRNKSDFIAGRWRCFASAVHPFPHEEVKHHKGI